MKLVKHLCLILAFLIALPVAFLAQTNTGSISGSVSDPNGAMIPSANVVATHVPTGRQYTSQTTQAGLYVFPDLPTGPYTITVKQEGFKAYVRSGIEVRLDLRETIDIKLELGKVTQTIEVKASASPLETTNAVRGTGLSPQTMSNLPLYTGGAVELATSFASYMPGYNSSSTGVSINGSNARAEEIMIDGGSLVSPESGGLSYYFPGFYAYSEMKLLTSGFSAENGRVGGGILEFVTKSGTNAVHGAAFMNIRRDIFDSVAWSTNQSAASRNQAPCRVPQAMACRPKERYNEEGGYAGGPVYIPHVYDGRNRTFWYFTFAGYWQPASVSTVTETQPTAAMLQGDFSELMYLQAGAIPIYDPNTTTSGGTRTAFAGNIIPTTRFSTISKNMMPYIPAGFTGTPLTLTNGTTGPAIQNNYLYNDQSIVTDKNWTFKIDHSIHQRNRIGFFGSHRLTTTNTDYYVPGPLNGGDSGINSPFYWRATDDYTINSHMLLHSLWSFSQDRALWQIPDQVGWGTKFGFPLTAGTNEDATPVISFSGDYNGCCTAWGMSQGKVANGGQWNWTTQVNQILTWTHNKHEIKMGWEIRRLRTIGNDWAGTNGAYGFARAETAYSATSSRSGNPFASFLLGDADSGSASALPVFVNQIRYGYQAGFIQDTYRIRPKFTVNLGLRFEVPIGWHETKGNYGTFQPTAGDYFPAANGISAVTIPGAVQFLGSGMNRTGSTRPYPNDYSEFGPRLGFAWNVKPSVVVRGSWGIFYQALGSTDCCTDGIGGGAYAQSSDGFNPAFQWDPGGYNPNKTSGNPGGVQPAASFAGPQQLPGVDNFGGWYEGGGNNLVYMGPHFGKAPRIYDWNLTLQKEYKGWLFEGAYVGNRGHGMWSTMMMNTLPTSDLYLGTAGPAGDPNLLGALAAGYNTSPTVFKPADTNLCIKTSTYSPMIGCTNGVPNQPFSTFNTWASGGTLGQMLRPYPQYSSVVSYNSGDGQTWYDAFQGKVEHRFGDLNLMGSWVYSKTLAMLSAMQQGTSGSTTTQGAQDYYNPFNDKSFASEDIPNYVNVVASYRAPFGRGKKWLSNVNPVVNHVVGGWIVAWTQQYHSGGLIAETNPTNYLPNETYNELTKLTATGLPIKTGISSTSLDPNSTTDYWFNHGTSAPIKATPAFTLGNFSYYNNQFRNPWVRVENMSLSKEVKIRESVLLHYQVNAFNIFNRTDFGSITGGLSSSRFGLPAGAQAGARVITMGLRLEF